MSTFSKPMIVVIPEHESLFTFIKIFSTTNNIFTASFFGIGALKNITMGFYQRDTQQHIVKTFSGDLEIASLNGNLTLAQAEPFVHIHASVAGENFQVFGGHIIEAFASASTELSVFPHEDRIDRTYDQNLKIFKIAGCQHAE